MKKSRYTEEQIIGILKQHEAGVKTAELCREHGIGGAEVGPSFVAGDWARARKRHHELRMLNQLLFVCPDRG